MDSIATENEQIAETLEKRNAFLADRKVRDYIEARERDRRDEVGRLQLAHKRGFEKGIEKGRIEGLENGLKKGLEKGLQRGRVEGLERGIEKGLKKGIERGRVEGEMLGKIEMIIDFLQAHFGEISSYLGKSNPFDFNVGTNVLRVKNRLENSVARRI